MSATLYEQFFAVGSVKSLLTGKNISSPRLIRKTPEQQKSDSDTALTEKRSSSLNG